MPEEPAAEIPAVAAAVAVLRGRHERVTPARLAVLDVLAGTSQHLNADEIITLAAGRAPHVHRATVYRALATLGELGLVAHTHLGGTSTVYHLLSPEPGTDQPHEHAHLQCTVCGDVLDIPAATMAPLQARLAAEQGFLLEPGHTALLGTCARCASRQG